VAADRHLTLVPTVLAAPSGEVAREITIDAPREIVFSYFSDPAKHILWQGTAAELDPRPGGRFRLTFAPGFVASGEYLDIDPPSRIRYTWGWEQEGSDVLPAGASTVEITLDEHDGETTVRLRHSGLPDPGMVEFHGHGWDECLTELARRITDALGSA
jgi:uncharacterized protein YndB with AHSA1/START domain